MTTYTIDSGYDTGAYQTSPTANSSAQTFLNAINTSGNTANIYLYVPIPPDVIGAQVASATLYGHNWLNPITSTTLGVYLITSSWSANTLTFNRVPTVGANVNTVVGATAANGQVALDVTSLVTSVAAGQAWLGFRISNATGGVGGAAAFWAFDSGQPAWSLTIVTSENPDTPQSLVPNGTVVGSGAPVLTCDFTDNGGLSNDMAAMNVQVNATNVWTSPTYDQTGTTTVPVFDLSSPPTGATAFTPVASGTTRWWRVRVQDADGNWSGWSNGASWTYRSQPSITLNNPAAGVVYDPTFIATATAGANLSAYRVQITDGTDRSSIRFDSGRLPANPAALTTIAVPVPEFYGGILPGLGSRVLVDGSTYQLHVQAWDTFTTRQSTPGSPAYAESWSNFTFANDGGVTAPASLTVTQPTRGPGVTLTWTRAATPDGWVMLRQGASDPTPKVINRSDGSDVTQVSTTYTWIDTHPQPWVSQTYTVKAITAVSGNPHQSNPSNTATITPQGIGVWIYTQSGQHVCLDGNAVDQLTVNDRRTTYKPVNLGHDVDIVTGFEGLSGTFTGTFPSDVDPTQSLTTVQSILLSIRANPQQWVRLVYGTFSGKVLLRNIAVLPSPLGNAAAPVMQVSFGVNQVGDFDQVRA